MTVSESAMLPEFPTALDRRRHTTVLVAFALVVVVRVTHVVLGIRHAAIASDAPRSGSATGVAAADMVARFSVGAVLLCWLAATWAVARWSARQAEIALELPPLARFITTGSMRKSWFVPGANMWRPWHHLRRIVPDKRVASMRRWQQFAIVGGLTFVVAATLQLASPLASRRDTVTLLVMAVVVDVVGTSLLGAAVFLAASTMTLVAERNETRVIAAHNRPESVAEARARAARLEGVRGVLLKDLAGLVVDPARLVPLEVAPMEIPEEVLAGPKDRRQAFPPRTPRPGYAERRMTPGQLSGA